MRYILSIVSAAFFWAACGLAGAMDWKDLHEKADKISLAEALADQEKNPQSQETLYTLGLVYLNLYKIQEAGDVFARMLAVDPTSIEARWGQAEILRRRHQPEKAEAVLDEIIKEDPEFSPASITLGYMIFDKKEYERSIRLALKVLKQGRARVDLTNYARAYLIIGGAKGMIADEGGIFSKLFQGTQILGYLKKAQELQPRSAGVLFGLGSFYALAPGIAGGDAEKGLSLLKEAIEVDPYFADAYARLAQIYFRRGETETARQYLADAKKLDPENPLTQRADNEINAKALKTP
ncbi:MAG: tetratricopeptide repeat protein [Candidatus Omnitrophica bacterium]|nr:tetratricopeptide repeat protein [Candidatus Omnitrophota bacterium]